MSEEIMVASHRGALATLVASFVVIAIPCTAQPAQDAGAAQALRGEIDRLKQDFDARLAALESRLAALEGAGQAAAGGAAPASPGGTQPAQPTAQVPAGAEGGGGPSGSLPVYGAAAGGSKVFNPDMAVIGNFIGAAGDNPINPLPALALPESEVSMQAIVDPYARADFFFSFGEEGVAVEEGYLTFPTLPGGLLMKVGRQYQAFGKANTLHAHVLPWADRPLVTTNLLGGDEPLADAGISVARLIPNPWIFLEATGQVSRGSGNEVFHGTERSDLSYVAHLRGYRDLSESANIDLGGSYAFGHNSSGVVDGADVGRFTTSLFGIDATVRWRPLQRAIYHSFLGRGEVIWSQREQPNGRQDATGFYVSGDYQFARRWFAGLRFDRSDRADDAAVHDTGQSFIVTYWPSEFSQVRGEYRRTKYVEGETANEFLFQFQFAIGAHGAHPF
jgi:hypothetical protein